MTFQSVTIWLKKCDVGGTKLPDLKNGNKTKAMKGAGEQKRMETQKVEQKVVRWTNW